ncbi:hypothetical protein EW146_g8469 [Bondarzewia mesenterica]|uniref:Uncharacterized protein n=1 Tax=Bondarzewia mesenterica TaxID=1095465 RepID=A0A4S4LE49_9AGAM|nr:hypothetical protein EW146_g8469 [Bondarzewia mesenterica]
MGCGNSKLYVPWKYKYLTSFQQFSIIRAHSSLARASTLITMSLQIMPDTDQVPTSVTPILDPDKSSEPDIVSSLPSPDETSNNPRDECDPVGTETEFKARVARDDPEAVYQLQKIQAVEGIRRRLNDWQNVTPSSMLYEHVTVPGTEAPGDAFFKFDFPSDSKEGHTPGVSWTVAAQRPSGKAEEHMDVFAAFKDGPKQYITIELIWPNQNSKSIKLETEREWTISQVAWQIAWGYMNMALNSSCACKLPNFDGCPDDVFCLNLVFMSLWSMDGIAFQAEVRVVHRGATGFLPLAGFLSY